MAFGALILRYNLSAGEASDDFIFAAFRTGKVGRSSVIGNVFLAADAFLDKGLIHGEKELEGVFKGFLN